MTQLVCDIALRHPGFHLAVALDLPTEGITAVFGRSGCGKTALLRCLAGLETGARGTIRFGDTLWQSDGGGNGRAGSGAGSGGAGDGGAGNGAGRGGAGNGGGNGGAGDGGGNGHAGSGGNGRKVSLPTHKRRVGMVFQDTRLFAHLSVRGNLGYGLARTPAGERRLELDRVAHLMDLAPLLDRGIGGLSGGERQRVALARAALGHPRLLLMDEPLAALDAGRKQATLPFIERLAIELGIAIVYVSHAMDEVVRLADRLVLMSDGRVVETGGVEALTSRLDLRPLTGRYDAGAVIACSVVRHDEKYALSVLAFDGGELTIPRVEAEIGRSLRVRIRARDVALALAAPTGTSFVNQLPGMVREIAADPGPQVDVLLDVGVPLWARVTRRSVDDLGLATGTPVVALVKAIAIDRHSLGRSLAPATRFTPNEDE